MESGSGVVVATNALPAVNKIVIKLSKTVFEEAISNLNEKNKRKRAKVHKKEKKKEKVIPWHNRRKRHTPSSPTLPFDEDEEERPTSSIFSPPPTPPLSPPPSPPSLYTPYPVTPTPGTPSSISSSSTNSTPSDNEPVSYINFPTEEDRSRESKKKFYKLLSSVVSKNSAPTEPEEFESLPTKGKLLTKSEKKAIAQLLRCRRHFPAEIGKVEGKGTGVKTQRDLACGQFVCEYAGELITKTEALKREKLYAATSKTYIMTCYMYYFEHRGQEMCIDATSEDGTWGIGRLINHSVDGNLATVKVVVNGAPRLAFVAKRFINAGEELTYDYGDRGQKSIAAFPWLKQ